MASLIVGILLWAGSSLISTVMFVFTKFWQGMGWPCYTIFAMSFAIAFGIFALAAGLLRASFPERRSVKWILLRGISGSIDFGSSVIAVQLGAPTGDVAALSSANTVFAALLGRVFLGEPLQVSSIVSVLSCIAGGVLISKPAFLFGSQASSVSVAAYLVAVCSGFFSAVTAISARKAGPGPGPPWFLNMSNLLVNCIAFAAFPFIPAFEEPSIQVLRPSLYSATICIVGVAILSVVSSICTTGGAMYCPAAVSATVNVSARLTLGYLADTLIFGVRVDFVSLCGAALMLGAVLLMAFSKTTTDVAGARVAEVPEFAEIELPAASADDETDSLASFIAAEFVPGQGRQEGAYRRRQAAFESPVPSPQAASGDRTIFGMAALANPPVARPF
eukprot:TRINITY_DN81249_c0_g1_i1.p1 TRINITY_DN81249_c0_g1~~TRINITY_DN81249_c0_g1_i1.p1  ORF type:complete len:390 (+),score=30.91 TRINITY_DN81249_c0_g1_i1:101-1270(+)